MNFGPRTEIPRLAETCVESAVFLIETCQGASQKNILLDNMCLLQAVRFAAALIVDLALFMEEGFSVELQKCSKTQ
ncbi:unnamed protein product [Penicillium camemberti]|uniref:Str. FM013 n=1 Tax=Penicillium camemberti (strain FM 013) TaxID=1429867 RepID=A0A0G4PTW7_PENC3|nr:unnamed protein product [Penicillium camemberti]